MQIFNSLLAETTDQIAKHHEQTNEIHSRVSDLYEFSFELMFWVMMATAIVVVFLFLRQKKLAQNQVNLANMMQELIDKE